MKVDDFASFVKVLRKSGFSMSGGSAHGVYCAIPFGWSETPPSDSHIRWHEGDAEHNPWEWRMLVLEQLRDVSYAKCFFGTGGFITKAWAADFYAVRRQGESFDEAYERGELSQMAKRIYETVKSMGEAPYHEIKARGGFHKEENSKFERAIVELQMKLYLTICGRAQRINQFGQPYGWNSTVLCTVEDFWRARGLDLETVSLPTREQAMARIAAQVHLLNPDAQEKTVRKFILG